MYLCTFDKWGMKFKWTGCQTTSVSAPDRLDFISFTQQSLCTITSDPAWTPPIILHASITLPESIPVGNCPTSQTRLSRVQSKMLPPSHSAFESESNGILFAIKIVFKNVWQLRKIKIQCDFLLLKFAKIVKALHQQNSETHSLWKSRQT